MNLHAAVRGAIPAVNPDQAIDWRVSTGATVDASYKQVPSYADAVTIQAQVQPMSGDDLTKVEYLNMQGIFRKVYAFGDVEGIVRPELKGGDLVQFPMTRGGTVRVWLVVHVFETWTPDLAGWCSFAAVLQEDAVAS